MLTLMIRILYIRKRWGGVGSIAAGDAEPGAVRASDVKGMVPFLTAVDAFDWAVTDAMFVVFG
jgi:hypothetical protein